MDLRNRDVMKALDPLGMLELIEDFPNQCRRALEIAQAVQLEPLASRPNAVVLCGMGGSAAGGDFVKALFEAQSDIPFSVVREYDLPGYVGAGSLVFIASYSGNTEETLSAYAQTIARGASVIVVSSGGQATEWANRHGHPVITVPGGQPPRSALGYMMVPVIVACVALGLLPAQPFDAAFAGLDRVSAALGLTGDDPFARELAGAMHGRIGLAYGLGGYRSAIANRWRCQFNENAKYLLFVNGYPELCHNEIMGWVAANLQADRYAGVLLTDGQEPLRMKVRAEVTEQVIGTELVPFTRAEAIGDTLLERMLSLTYIGDWVSIYLARLNGVDPTQIANIDTLKDALAKLPS
ncbi:MAG: bifunctional phosphoglucose/phosphomannose isomerase [Fimbriimonadaceae bacterium]|nr:bifunctional phosphoglucose/phosphomannose isomerase [Fimbriimonadaceae bacterium]